jgi:hypothetical protein
LFNTSDYYVQSFGLPVKNGYQLTLLKWADTSTLFREAGKAGTIMGRVSSVSSFVFNFNPTISLLCTAISCCLWLLFSTCAKKLEPQAQDMIQYFKNVRDGKDW